MPPSLVAFREAQRQRVAAMLEAHATPLGERLREDERDVVDP